MKDDQNRSVTPWWAWAIVCVAVVGGLWVARPYLLEFCCTSSAPEGVEVYSTGATAPTHVVTYSQFRQSMDPKGDFVWDVTPGTDCRVQTGEAKYFDVRTLLTGTPIRPESYALYYTGNDLLEFYAFASDFLEAVISTPAAVKFLRSWVFDYWEETEDLPSTSVYIDEYLAVTAHSRELGAILAITFAGNPVNTECGNDA